MPFLDRISLIFENNIIVSDTPDIVPLETLAHIHNKGSGFDVESFGLFDAGAPNFVTYYPDVKAEDLKPKEEDFVYPTYRALSEVIVHRRFNPVDFSMNGALKKSTKLLIGQTVYPNHEAMVGQELGTVKNTAWEDAHTMSNGVFIPAGINARLKIDGKSNPKIARGINMDPPSIHSTSVTVEFLWDKSHPELSDDEFWAKLGKFDDKKQMYRRVATKVNRYDEISFVRKGADPFAQKINEKGEIVNPTEADIRNNPKLGLSQKYYRFDFKNIIQNSEDELENEGKEETIPNNSNENDNDKNIPIMNKAFLLSLVAIFGLTGDDFTDAKITEEILKNALIKKKGEMDAATALLIKKYADAGINDLTAEQLTALQANAKLYIDNKEKLGSVEGLQTFQTARLKELKDSTQAVYMKLMGDKPNDAILALIQGANWEVLLGLKAQYETQLNEKFPLTCKKCGGKEVNRASASLGNGEDAGQGNAGEGSGAGDSSNTSLTNLLKKKRTASNLKMAGMETEPEEKKDK